MMAEPPLGVVVAVTLNNGDATLAYRKENKSGKRQWYFPCPKIYFDLEDGYWRRYVKQRVSTSSGVQAWSFLSDPEFDSDY